MGLYTRVVGGNVPFLMQPRGPRREVIASMAEGF
jgi:hypothetical protein